MSAGNPESPNVASLRPNTGLAGLTSLPRADTLKDIARRIRQGDCEQSLGHSTEASSDVRNTDKGKAIGGASPAHATRDPHFSHHAMGLSLPPEDLAKLAHELKTPITAIAAAAEIMRDERLGKMGNARYLGYAADIHDSAMHALNVIAAMLSGGMPHRHTGASADDEDIDLNDLVARTVSIMQPLADERGQTLTFQSDDVPQIVTGNATTLRQILLNLLTNAIKFTPRGGDVRAVTARLSDGSALLIVRDTGNGIHGAEPSDATGGSASLEGGLGIGLPLVRRLAQDMGAELEIDSADGAGTVAILAFDRSKCRIA